MWADRSRNMKSNPFPFNSVGLKFTISINKNRLLSVHIVSCVCGAFALVSRLVGGSTVVCLTCTAWQHCLMTTPRCSARHFKQRRLLPLSWTEQSVPSKSALTVARVSLLQVRHVHFQCEILKKKVRFIYHPYVQRMNAWKIQVIALTWHLFKCNTPKPRGWLLNHSYVFKRAEAHFQ